MKENKVKNINFFKKIWYSITKFEQYPAMAAEGIKTATRYLLILITLVTVAAMGGSLLQTNKMMRDLSQYIQENIPEFSYNDGKIEMNTEEPIVINDIQYQGIDRIVIDPMADTAEQKEKDKTDNSMEGIIVFLFKDEIVLVGKTSESDKTAEQVYTYSNFIQSYTGTDIQSFNKTDFTNYLTSERMIPFYTRYGLSIFIYLLIMNVIYALLDAFEIAILGWITGSLAKIKIKFSALYSMAAYALTLSLFLNIIYIVINYFTTFSIKYFQVAYIAIAYIYLAATIFILKDDLIRKLQEVEKIREEQKNVKEEIKEQEDKKEEEPKEEKKEKNDKKEDDEGEEPQGSEA